MKLNVRKEKGITLIALIVTIIVLIILAGVSINLLLGENGIIKKAQDASGKYNEATIREKIEMALANLEIEKIALTDKLTVDLVLQELLANGIFEGIDLELGVGYIGENAIKLKYNEKQQIVIEEIQKYNGVRTSYKLNPVGYTKEEKVSILFTVKGTIKSVTRPDNLVVYPQKETLEIQYDVTENGTYKFIIEDEEGNKSEKNVIVNTIDTIEPTMAEISIDSSMITKSSITITTNAIDEQSGILRYEYYVKDNDDTEYTKYDSEQSIYAINNLQPETDYTVYVIAYDKANNGKKSNSVTCKTKSSILDYPILTEYGVMNCIDDNNNYYFDKNVTPKQADALPLAVYDGKEDAAISVSSYSSSTRYIDISPEMQGKEITIVWTMAQYTTYGIKCYGETNEELSSSLTTNVSCTKKAIDYTIEKGTKRIEVYLKSGSSGSGGNGSLLEIKLKDQPTISATQYYPVLTQNGIEPGHSIVTIDYFPTSVQRLYKIDDGEWQEYKDQTIRLELGETIYAKGIDKNGKETVAISSYKAEIMSDELPPEAYNGQEDTAISISSYSSSTTYIDVSPEMQGKEITIVWTMAQYTTYGIKCYDETNEEFSTSLISRQSCTKKAIDYTIEQGTKRIAVYLASGVSGSGGNGSLLEIKIKE